MASAVSVIFFDSSSISALESELDVAALTDDGALGDLGLAPVPDTEPAGFLVVVVVLVALVTATELIMLPPGPLLSFFVLVVVVVVVVLELACMLLY